MDLRRFLSWCCSCMSRYGLKLWPIGIAAVAFGGDRGSITIGRLPSEFSASRSSPHTANSSPLQMSLRLAVQAGRLLSRTPAKQAAVAVAYASKQIHSSQPTKGVFLDVSYHILLANPNQSISIAVHRANLNQSGPNEVCGDNGSIAPLWLLPHSMSPEIHPAILGSEGRIDPIHSSLRYHSSLDFPP